VDTGRGVPEAERLTALRRRYAGTRLKATAAKIFADGVMEPHTAALLEPYVDRPGDRGTPLLEPDAFDALAIALDRAGFQIHVHAIGDRAVRMSLDAFAAAGRANGFRDMRHHIAHLELIDPTDIPRFRRLGVAANFQALWAYADPYITELTLPILALPDRQRGRSADHDRRRKRLVGILYEPPRGHPGGPDAEGARRSSRRGLDPRGTG
jgi:predicted amidohydrolase YtcJ